MTMTFEEKLAAFKAQMKNPAAQAAPAAPVAPPGAPPAAPVAPPVPPPAAPVSTTVAAPAVPVAPPVAAPAAPVAPPLAAAPAPEQAPKRRGRPAGSTNKAKETIDTTAIVAILEKMAEEQAKTNEEIRMTCVAFRASIGFPQ